jgi:hypothetical protein
MVNTFNTTVKKSKGIARNKSDAAATNTQGHSLKQVQQKQLRQLHASTSSRVEEFSDNDVFEDGGSGTLHTRDTPGDASDPEEPAQRPSRAIPGRAAAHSRTFNPAGLDSAMNDLGTPSLPSRGRHSLSLGRRQSTVKLYLLGSL